MEMKETARERCHRAERGMAAATMPKRFAAHAVLLTRESQRHKRDSEQLRRRAREGVQTTMTNPNAEILNAKEIVDSGTRRATILAGLHEEKEREQ